MSTAAKVRNPEETRQHIIREAAIIFNEKGYNAGSITDVMKASGFEKGGIYNHFASKQELVIEAFQYLVGRIRARIVTVLEAQQGSYNKLMALLDMYTELYSKNFTRGGCPILNAAIDADDANPGLMDHAKAALESNRQLFVRLVNRAKEQKSLSEAVDTDELASYIVANIEGAVVISRTLQQPERMGQCMAQLKRHIMNLHT